MYAVGVVRSALSSTDQRLAYQAAHDLLDRQGCAAPRESRLDVTVTATADQHVRALVELARQARQQPAPALIEVTPANLAHTPHTFTNDTNDIAQPARLMTLDVDAERANVADTKAEQTGNAESPPYRGAS